jgi:hypothetical protein
MKRLALSLLCSLSLGICAQEQAELTLIKTVPLPGVKGRFDHFAVDAKTHRIFVAGLGNNTLEIIDVAAAKRLHTITGLHKPTGVAYLPEANQIIVANGDDGTVKIFDGTSYKLTKKIPALDDADNVRVDAKAQVIYAGYGDGALAAVDVQKFEQVGTVTLKGHPESFQLEQNGDRIFVNVPDAKHIAVADRQKRTVIATWPMEKFRANFPMALDEANHRLFVGCRTPARLVIFDTTAGRAVTDLAISGDTDDLFYDAKLKRLYISCGEGFVDVVDQRDADSYRLRERIATRAGARTSFFSADFNEFYLAVPQRGNQEAELRVFQSHE